MTDIASQRRSPTHARLAVLLLVVCTGCGIHDIVVAELPPNDGGMMFGGPPGKICIVAADCPLPGDFCEYPSCAASAGKCSRSPALCPPTFDPHCGCNGVTYWNDCVRKGAGQAASTQGECGAPAGCGAGTLCPDPQASCARLLPRGSSCSVTPISTCWVVPLSCPPPIAVNDAWETCGGGAPVCSGLCSAIRSGQIRRAVDFCP